jgi:hypothetical protein
LTPEEIQFGKEVLAQFTIVSLAAIGAWKLAKRQERQSVYLGPPDDQPRKLTRKEWHNIADPVQAHILKFYTLEKDTLPRMEKDIDDLRRIVADHIRNSNENFSIITRMDERLTQHIKHWDAGTSRAIKDREEILTKMETMDEKLDRLERKS